MAVVRKFKQPDLFITMSASTKWPEIQKAMRHVFPDGTTLQQAAQWRPDIVNRVFKLKAKQLIDDITKNEIFGKVAAYMGVYEFQKRGLPHLHLIVILDKINDKIWTTEDIDDFICAEMPDLPDGDPNSEEFKADPIKMEKWRMWKLVEEFMIHKPCGNEDPYASCMVNGKCRFSYPKE